MSEGGGYLFPVLDVVEGIDATQADKAQIKDMKLRDYFAAAALQGILARGSQPASLSASRGSLAAAAFEYADEMLKARAR